MPRSLNHYHVILNPRALRRGVARRGTVGSGADLAVRQDYGTRRALHHCHYGRARAWRRKSGGCRS
jgi:hypothetical protein